MKSPRLSARNVGVDVLRAFSIMVVLADHLAGSPTRFSEGSIYFENFYSLFDSGILGVSIFFVISGYLITKTTMEREVDFFSMSPSKFYTYRVGRIIPLLFFILAVSVAILVWNPQDYFSAPMFHFIYDAEGYSKGLLFWFSLIFFLRNWERILSRGVFAGAQWDIIWSLAVEEQFYIMFPWVVRLSGTLDRLCRVLLVVIVLGIVSRAAAAILNFSFVATMMNSFSCFEELAIGVLCALYARDLKISRGQARLMTIAGAAAVVGGYLGSDIHGARAVLGPTTLAMGVALFIAGTERAELFRSSLSRGVARIGQLSYGIYLLHPLVLFLISGFLIGLSRPVAFTVFLALCLCVAEVSFRLYEQPMNAMIRRVFAARRRDRATVPIAAG
jgi:peptidoglycan/LPS O-acetylase OafA/YrhL